MLEAFVLAIPVVALVALTTGSLVYARAGRFSEPERIREKGLAVVAREDARWMALLALVAGLLAALGYSFLSDRIDFAPQLFLGLGLGLAVVLSIAAAIVRPRLGMRGVPEVLALNLLWGVAYGLAIPAMIELVTG